MGKMKIDKNNSVPFYIQVREALRFQIESGARKALESLPSEDVLCREYKVSRITIKKALDDLKKEGYIVRVKSKGSFVNLEIPRKEEKRNFKNGKKMFAFVVPDIEDVFISEIYRGIESVATENGYKVLILSSDRDIEGEGRNIEFLRESNIAGAIIFPFWGRFNALQVLNLKKRGFPFVLIDRYFRDIQTDAVVVDNFNGAFHATGHLFGLGHRKIAHIMGVECTANEDRFEGYRAALQKAGIPFNPLLVREIQPFETEGSLRFEPDETGGYKEMKSLLSRKNKPTAVFAGNDYIALGCYRAIRDSGLKVPDDISVVGFDNIALSAEVVPPLTTIDPRMDEMGRLAVRRLADMVENGETVPVKVTLPSVLVERSSVKKLV